MCKLLRNDNFKRCVLMVLTIQLVFAMTMMSFASGGGNYAESGVKWFLDQAFWVVIAITVFGAIAGVLKHATSAIIITIIVGGLIAFLCKQPETIANITLYSYHKIWKIEKKIYAIQNIVLPIPIDPWELLYFGATWVVCNVIFGLLPGVSNIPVMIRSIMLPFAISKFLMTKKLDGKNPLRYMLGVITFLFVEQGKSVEFFQTTPDKEATIKLTWNCSEGRI